jgi:hypothetical protein
MTTMFHRPSLLLLTLLLAACAVPGYKGKWLPPTADLAIAAEDGSPIAQLAISVPGQWVGDEGDGEVRVLFRLENVGHGVVTLPPERCTMRFGDGSTCGSPRRVGDSNLDVQPGAAALVELGFMPPSRDADLQHLVVEWVLMVDGHALPGSQGFDLDESRLPRYGGIKVSVAEPVATPERVPG